MCPAVKEVYGKINNIILMHANAQNNVTKYYCYSSIVPCRLPNLFNDYYSYNNIMYSACNIETLLYQCREERWSISTPLKYRYMYA